MKRRLKEVQVVLLITASFLAPGGFAHSYCDSAGTDFHTPDVNIENPDQSDLFIDHHELKIVGSNGLSGVFLLESFLLEELPLIAFHEPSPDAKIITLRC